MTHKNLGLRVTGDLHAWLRAEADQEHRSLNQQAIHLIERAREQLEYERGNLPTTDVHGDLAFHQYRHEGRGN